MNNSAANSSVVVPEPEVLRGFNYRRWSVLTRKSLTSQHLWDVTRPMPTTTVLLTDQEWSRKNDEALPVIQSLCRQDIFDSANDVSSAKNTWDALENMFHQYNNINPGMLEGDERTEYVTFLRGIRRGERHALRNLLDKFPDVVDGVIFPGGLTVLHIASVAGHLRIVEELFRIVREDYLNDYLEIQDENGDTALSLAAYNGKKEVAERLVQQNDRLLTTWNHEGNIPLVVACQNNQAAMTSYLYSVTPYDFLLPETSNQGALFIKYAMLNDMPDIGVDLYKRCPRLATSEGSITLLDLTVKRTFFRRTTPEFLGRTYDGLEVTLPSPSASDLPELQTGQNVKLVGEQERLYKIKLTHTFVQVVLSYWCEKISTFWDSKQLAESGVISAVFKAIVNGMTEVVVGILEANPDLIFSDKNLSREIHVDVIKYRQQDIMKFIYSLEAGKKAFHSVKEDVDGNNLLHLIAKYPDYQRYHTIFSPGVYKRELKWFQELKKVLPVSYRGAKNLEGETPQMCFLRTHYDLKKDGEEWVRSTAGSYSIITALIVTIMFAAAFTFPGGNDQSTGVPIFLRKKLFVGFMACDIISLFLASYSILIFLVFLTAPYGLDSFGGELLGLLLTAIAALVISIFAMLLAFSFAVMIMLTKVWASLLCLGYVAVVYAFFWQLVTVLPLCVIGCPLKMLG